MDRLKSIVEACSWVAAKGTGSRDGCKVTTHVRWADWDKKEFSPAMCVLWWGEVGKNAKDGYDTFWIPSPDTWVQRVANVLQTTPEWVLSFVEQCSTGFVRPERYSATITFDYIEGENKNPRIEWRHEPVDTSQLMPEVVYCIENYGHVKGEKNTIPYYTKNPPINHYSSKTVKAVYDLFEALKVTDRLTIQK